MLASIQSGSAEATNAVTTIQDFKIMLGMVSSDAWEVGMQEAQCVCGYNLVGSALLTTATPITAISSFPTVCWQGSAPHAFTARNERGSGRGQERQTVVTATAFCFFPDGATDSMKRRGLYVIDITRLQGGSGSFTIDSYGPPTSAVTFSPSPADMMDVVNTLNTSIVISGATLTRNTVNVNMPEWSPLDTMFIYSSCAGMPLMIYAIGAVVYNDQPYDASVPGGSYYSMNEQPVSGTSTPLTASTDLTGGWGWLDSSFSLVGTSDLSLISAGLTGTQAGPVEVFQLYNTSPTAYGSFISPNAFLTYGTGWADIGTIYGTTATGIQNGYAGTTMNYPWEVFQIYNTGSVASSVLTYGTGWDGVGFVTGTNATETPQSGYSGTSSGWPYDTFEQYNTGAVTTGVTINAGTGWSGAATIN